MAALVAFTSRRSIMGEFTNSPLASVAAVVATILILSLNLLLAADALGFALPF